MPLSDHEQKMLDEMERRLFADDPKLARAFDPAPRQRRSTRRIVLGLLGVGVGLALLVLAVALPAIWLGVLAFLLMVAGGIAAVTAPSRTVEGQSSEADGRSAAAASQSAFLRRMEERWERRSGPDGQG